MVDTLSKRLFPPRQWGEKFFQILQNVVLFIQSDGLENTGQTYSQKTSHFWLGLEFICKGNTKPIYEIKIVF